MKKLESLKFLAERYIRLKVKQAETDLAITTMKEQILKWLNDNNTSKVEIDNIIIQTETRPYFYVSKEIKEKYGLKKDSVYLFVKENT